MEGYSVTEAASILGVPTERVWELLARGVLSGAAEGETGMRVYLQPRPAPAPPVAEPGRPNGDGAAREPERELSPFRELLTEFRNLTERYGQALLALGEARGEVAALRSRVDLLEARMDLRLPMSAAPTAWPAPMPQPTSRNAAQTEESDATADDESDVAHDPDEERPARRRRHRRATENFAEALARAEDPSRPELPGAAETAAALAALRAGGAADARGSDSSLPHELPAADAIPIADEADQPASRADAAVDPEPPAAPEAEVRAPATVLDEPQTPATSEVEPELQLPADDGAGVPDGTEGVESREPVTPDPGREPEPEAEPTATVPSAPEPEPEPDRVAPVARDLAPIPWDPQRYSVDIGEPDWFVEEEPPPAAIVDDEPERSVEPTPSAGEAADAPPETTAVPATEPPAAAESAPESEETMLWFGDEPSAQPAPPAVVTDPGTGADEMEVVGSQPPPAPPAPRVLPGSRELDEALAALDALAGRTRPVEPPAPTAGATADRALPTADRPSTAPLSSRAEPPTSRVAAEHPRLATTPASRAYRRLRRIFPG